MGATREETLVRKRNRLSLSHLGFAFARTGEPNRMRLPVFPRMSAPVLQGAYFAATGIWPLISRRSFERVTGPKADFWLAQTVGVLVTAIGTALLTAEWRQRVTPEVELLAVSAGAGLGLTEAMFAVRGRISKVYLVDALVEAALLASWARRAAQGRRAD
jgi:hypothetical protein